MAKYGREETRDTRLLAEVQVCMTESGGFDFNQNLVVSQLFIHLDRLELPRSSWLRNNEGVSKHFRYGILGGIFVGIAKRLRCGACWADGVVEGARPRTGLRGPEIWGRADP